MGCAGPGSVGAGCPHDAVDRYRPRSMRRDKFVAATIMIWVGTGARMFPSGSSAARRRKPRVDRQWDTA